MTITTTRTEVSSHSLFDWGQAPRIQSIEI
jgi:hypothetical protein